MMKNKEKQDEKDPQMRNHAVNIVEWRVRKGAESEREEVSYWDAYI